MKINHIRISLQGTLRYSRRHRKNTRNWKLKLSISAIEKSNNNKLKQIKKKNIKNITIHIK